MLLDNQLTTQKFDVFLTVHHSIDFSKYQNTKIPTLHPHTVRLLTEGDDTRGCGDKIGPLDDEQRAARNMLRSVM